MSFDDSAVPALGVIDFQDACMVPTVTTWFPAPGLLPRWEPETVNLWALTYWQAPG